SLLRSSETRRGYRFHLFESVRQYAAEKMAEPRAIDGDDHGSLTGPKPAYQLALRHAHHYGELGTVEYLESLHTHGGISRQWSLVAETENLLAAADFCLNHGHSIMAAQVAMALAPCGLTRGPITMAIEVVKKAADMPHENPETPGRLQLCLGTLSAAVDLKTAQRHLTKALSIFRQEQNKYLEGVVLGHMGELELMIGQLAQARSSSEVALAIHRQLANIQGEGEVLVNLSGSAFVCGQIDRAQQFIERALAIHEERGDRRAEGTALMVLGDICAARGLFDEARRKLTLALAIAREVGDKVLQATALNDIGDVEQRAGRYDEALACFEQGIGVAREVGARRLEGACLGNLGELHLRQLRYDHAEACLERALSILDGKSSIVGVFKGTLALCRAHGDDFGSARELLQQGKKELRQLNYVMELGILLCREVRVEQIAGDLDAAHKAFDEATELAAEHNIAAESEFAKRLAELENLFSSGLRVGPDAFWFEVGSAPRVDLRKRGVLRRLLLALCQNKGTPMDADTLFAAAWPGQNIRSDAAAHRVHVSVSRLRNMGLKDVLHTLEKAYYLDPESLELVDD
ncbi:MAG: tetratricopeptide repeat protein, partial [Proteobacteria bacterium]|nr:tetratricopeptide repeat protein [Pseudomonadota bacterium]